jgi:ABC-type sugar transport system substrate-binding protein
MRKRTAAIGGIALFAALAMAVAVSAAPSRTSADIVIGNIPPVIANPTIKAMDQGIKNQAKKLGMSAITIGGEFDPQAQIVAMDAAIQKKVSAISIWPLDPKGIAPSIAKAKAAGIPVFTLWARGVPNITANFQYDDYETAVAIAKLSAAELKKQGKDCNVGIIQGIPVVTILKTRNDGLLAGAKASGCTVLEQIVNTKDNSDGAQPIAAAWKAKHGSKMTAILAYNDPSAMGALATVGGDFQPLVTGFNGDSIAVDALKAKRLFASAAAPNVEIGNTIAWVVHQMLVKKAKVPNDYQFKYEILTQQNISKYVSFETRNKSAETIVKVTKKGKLAYVTIKPDFAAALKK